MTEQKAPTRRETRRIETTERILDAAMRLMVDRGYEAFTIARLAKELDYAVGALYRYFKGKDAILAALQMRVVNGVDDDLEQIKGLTEASPAASDAERALLHVATGIGVYESLTFRRPTHHWLLSLSLGDPRELLAQEVVDAGILPPLRAAMGKVAERVFHAQQVGALSAGDPIRRTVILWGASQGVMQLRKLGRFDDSLADRTLATELYRGLLMGWGADAEALDALLAKAIELVGRLPSE